MGRIEKTVFISYRRTNFPWALAIFQDLTQHGYDVFFDFTGLGSGDFETVILENIRTRAHFLVLLTPSALDRCAEPGDWLRREIEAALDDRRNIVPLMLEGFDFSTPTIAGQLTGKLAVLKKYSALSIAPAFFFDAMTRLRDRYLNVALDAVSHPASAAAQLAAADQKSAAEMAPTVTERELTAQQWFESGTARLLTGDSKGALPDFDNAVRLKPDYVFAFVNRGAARYTQGNFGGALEDYDQAIRLKPDLAEVFYNRAKTRSDLGDINGALDDYKQAIRLDPDHTEAFYNRGNLRRENGDLEGAVKDYTRAIRLKPDHVSAFNNRALARSARGDLEGALQDYDQAIRLKPDHAFAFNNRGNARHRKGDLKRALGDYTKPYASNPTLPMPSTIEGLGATKKGTWRVRCETTTRPFASSPLMPTP